MGVIYTMGTEKLDTLVTSESLEQLWSNVRTMLLDMRPTSKEYTLSVDNWIGESAPYFYELSVTGVTNNTLVAINLANSLTDAEFDNQSYINLEADIRRVKQSNDKLTFVAYGRKPTIDLIFDIAIL